MSFYASNDRIVIRAEDGYPVFDTDHPMPHILQRFQVNGVVADFPKLSRSDIGFWQTWRGGCSTYQCRIEQQTVCSTIGGVYACRLTPVQVCGNVATDGITGYTQERTDAMEWENTVTIGTMSLGVQPDFLLINCKGRRTVNGAQYDYGTFLTGITAEAIFIANGSTILERVFAAGGDPWLSRIMSVYAEGPEIKVQFRHSNRSYDGRKDPISYCQGAIPPSPNSQTRSVYSFDFDIYAGKFSQ